MRYRSDVINEYLIEELEWLRSVRSLLLLEINRKQGKLSGFLLNQRIESCLDEAIRKLEIKEQQIQNSQ